MKPRSATPSAIGMAFLTALSCARGDTIVDNIAQPINSLQQIENGSDGSAGNRFVNGPSLVQLSSVSLDMRSVITTGGNFTVSIWSDSGASHAPASLLEQLSGNPDPSAGGIFTYTPINHLLLSPGTSYWVVAGVSSGPAVFVWNDTASALFGGSGSIGGRLRGDYQTPGSFVAPETSGPFLFQVNATPVPEPKGVAVVTGAGLLAAALFRRHRTRTGFQVSDFR